MQDEDYKLSRRLLLVSEITLAIVIVIVVGLFFNGINILRGC